MTVTDGVGRYPSEVEAAMYFSCLEALQNSAKHAGEACLEQRAWAERAACCSPSSTTVRGSTRAARPGHGFVNMADRLGAVGGAVRWDSEPGKGATISGSVPLET